MTAEAIDVQADTMAGLLGVPSTWETSYVDLVVNGTTIVSDGGVPSWTRIKVPGVGRVVLNGRVCTSENPVNPRRCCGDAHSSIQAFAINVILEVPDNPFGLPVGAQVKVGESFSSVRFVPAL